MKYIGSKNKISGELLDIMLPSRGDRTWVEPFVGGGNMIDKVQGRRLGADANPRAVEALIIIRDKADELPKNNTEFTEGDYALLRKAEHPIKSFAGFAYSYAAKWLGGWARDRQGGDYVDYAYRNAQRQSEKLQGCTLVTSSYQDLQIPYGSLIYCDPPYKGTQGYGLRFDHEAFWQWARDRTDEGHLVYVSEYEAPGDFVSVWEKEVNNTLAKNTGAKKGVEKLFVMDALAL